MYIKYVDWSARYKYCGGEGRNAPECHKDSRSMLYMEWGARISGILLKVASFLSSKIKLNCCKIAHDLLSQTTNRGCKWLIYLCSYQALQWSSSSRSLTSKRWGTCTSKYEEKVRGVSGSDRRANIYKYLVSPEYYNNHTLRDSLS